MSSRKTSSRTPQLPTTQVPTRLTQRFTVFLRPPGMQNPSVQKATVHAHRPQTRSISINQVDLRMHDEVGPPTCVGPCTTNIGWRSERELDMASSAPLEARSPRTPHSTAERGRSNGLLGGVVEKIIMEAAGQGRGAIKSEHEGRTDGEDVVEAAPGIGDELLRIWRGSGEEAAGTWRTGAGQGHAGAG